MTGIALCGHHIITPLRDCNLQVLSNICVAREQDYGLRDNNRALLEDCLVPGVAALE